MAVFDGIDFVSHSGLSFNGVQTCVTVDGVYMTPDHEVLTYAGWKNASQLQGHSREKVRYFDSSEALAVCERQLAVADAVRLWKILREANVRLTEGSEERAYAELRMPNAAAYRAGQYDARNVGTSAIHSLAKHAKPLLQRMGACIQELRGKGHNSVRTMARQFRELFGRHAVYLRAGVDTGAPQQRPGVFSEQLLLGHMHGAGTKHAQHNTHGERPAACRTDGYKSFDDLLQTTARMAGVQAENETGFGERKEKAVYDIVDCGPRNRFIVRGVSGTFAVHNCTQGTARIVMSDGLLRIDKEYRVLGTVHDEGIGLVPEYEAQPAYKWMLRQMVVVPKWMPGIPLNADGGVHKRYGLAKN
jgi:hypothetical protein